MQVKQSTKNQIKIGKSLSYSIAILFTILMLTSIPYVHAYTNQFTQIAASSCTTCSNPITISDTATSTSDLIVIQLTCLTNFAITGITDTITNSFGNTGTTNSFSFSNNNIISGHTGTTSEYTFVWFASAKSTSASTASITTSSAESDCSYSTFDGNTIFTAFSTTAISGVTYTPSISGPGTFPFVLSQTYQANSIVLAIGDDIVQTQTYNVNGAGSAGTAMIPLGYIGGSGASVNYFTAPLNDGPCIGVSCYFGFFYGTFQTNSQVQTGLGFNFGQYGYNVPSGQHANNLMVYVFSTTGTISSTGATTTQVGCTSGRQTSTSTNHNFALPSNATYWFQGNAFGLPYNTFQTITNISVWVNSVSLTNSQTTATLWITLYAQNVYSSNNINLNLPAAGNQYGLGFYYPALGVTVTNTATKSHLSISGITLNIQSGQQYAIGLFSTHNGINIGTCPTGSPTIYYQNQLSALTPRSPAVNQAYLSGATATAYNMSMFVLINNPGIITLQTVTSTVAYVTVFSTVISTTTATTITATATVTITVITNALQGGTGGAQMITNLITYFPIWFLPLIFGFMGGFFNFGLGGLLFGLMLGLTLGVLDGQLPLWTVFVDALMVYLLLRR